jgi:hypothetical protein
MKKLCVESAYREALKRPLENMTIPAKLVAEIIERNSELETAVIDLRAALRTCESASNGAMLQYKDL